MNSSTPEKNRPLCPETRIQVEPFAKNTFLGPPAGPGRAPQTRPRPQAGPLRDPPGQASQPRGPGQHRAQEFLERQKKLSTFSYLANICPPLPRRRVLLRPPREAGEPCRIAKNIPQMTCSGRAAYRGPLRAKKRPRSRERGLRGMDTPSPTDVSGQLPRAPPVEWIRAGTPPKIFFSIYYIV